MYGERVRHLTLTLVVAALGVGGVALAQPELVVDPWGSAKAEADSWFADSTNERADVLTADPVLVDPWQPEREPERAPRAKRVEVFPIAPATNASPRSAPPRSAALPPLAAPIVVDPWAPAVGSELPPLEGKSVSRVAEQSSPWSGRMIEIVDPWGRVPELGASKSFRVIIDPWAR